MLAWYLVYSKPQQERVALDNLVRQGFEAYLPVMRIQRRRQAARVAVLAPMFPRYLFIHLSDETDDWGPIRSTRGVSRLVSFGSQVALVPDDLIAALRLREDEEGVQCLPEPEYRSGDRVRIWSGPMAGYEGIFTARSGKARVLLLLDIAGKAARVQVSGDDIEPAARVWRQPR